MPEQLGIDWDPAGNKETEGTKYFSEQEARSLAGRTVRAKTVIREGVSGRVGVIGTHETGTVNPEIVRRADGAWAVRVTFEVDLEGQRPTTQGELSRTARVDHKWVEIAGPDEFRRLFEESPMH